MKQRLKPRLPVMNMFISARPMPACQCGNCVMASAALRIPDQIDVRPRYTEADVRELLERPYRLIYRVLADRIEIVTVMHYRQLMPSDVAHLNDRG